MRAGPKGSNPRSRATPGASRAQASKREISDGDVESAVNAWGLLASGLKQASDETDGHRTIGRTWHVSRWNNSALAEAICFSTRTTLPLPHPEMIRSSLPLTIRGFCLCLTTIKPSLILAGRSRPRHGEPYSSVLNKEYH